MIEVIAELGINHNGDMNTAKKLIDVSCATGCNYVKLQKRTIDLVYSKEELDKPRESPWGTTTRQQKEGLEFNLSAYKEIDEYCTSKGISWFASPWDVKSVAFLEGFDSPFIKIPSALITNYELLERCRDTGKQVILSTGMSVIMMVDHAVEVIGRSNIYSIMHCTSTYPSSPDEINLNALKYIKDRYPFAKLGFSNHYPGLMALLGASLLGAEMLELHITLDRSSYGSDQAASIEPHGLFELTERLRLIERMKGNGVKKIYDSEKPIMAKLRR